MTENQTTDQTPPPAEAENVRKCQERPEPDARDGAGHFRNCPGPGRPRGTRNRTLAAVLRDDLAVVYRQKGGPAWLRGLPDRDFLAILARVVHDGMEGAEEA